VRELPTGTVTFLFTDVEGSTKLLHKLGAEAYAGALAEHRRVIREATAAHDGVEVDTQGDAFFVAFSTAPAALAAAEAVNEGLSDVPIHVRMGLHSGTPRVTDEGYVGADVHRAARIAAAGHGSQILASASTAALVGKEGLRDLGPHRTTRHYTDPVAMRTDVVNARVWNGIDFRSADVAGAAIGVEVSNWALDHDFAPTR
jgi:class 3 adenylate cyclase